MRLTTDALRAALRTTSSAVELNPSAPVLAGVQLAAKDGTLVLATTDHLTWITTCVVGELLLNDDEWTARVSHKKLMQLAGVLRAKEVELTHDGRTVRLSAGRSFWLLPTMVGQVTRPPSLPPVVATVAADQFARETARVALAASDEVDLRPALNVTEVTIEPAAVYLAATNRYRIHTAELDATASERLRAYPDADALARAASMLEGETRLHGGTVIGDADVFGLSDDRTTVIMRTVGVETWMKIDENLERWQRTIKATTTISGSLLADAIKSAVPALADDDFGGAIFEVGPTTFIVRAADADSGARAEVDVEDFEHEGPGLRSVIRPAVVLPTLSAAGDRPVALSWTRPDGPLLITVDGQPGTSVIMPLAHDDAGWVA